MLKEFKTIILFVIILFLTGSLGYSFLEGWSFFDSLYMTIITLSTTGFQELRPLSPAGRIFTMVLIVFGISVLFYVLGNLNVAIFEGNLFKDRKMQKQINQLNHHYIVCGYGRMGKKIAHELNRRGKKFIIIEIDNDAIDTSEGFLFIHGDSTEDIKLIEAGIKRAVGVVSVLENDISNVFATLSARELNPKLKIIARAEEESSREKLLKAGADRVILPYEIGGFRMTQALLKPTVVDYFDEIFSRSDIGLEIEEIKLHTGSKLIGQTLADCRIRSDFNIVIIGIYRSSGDWVYNPGPQTQLDENATLIVIGETKELDKLQKIAGHENI
jgi:voltage-gated potassium channel